MTFIDNDFRTHQRPYRFSNALFANPVGSIKFHYPTMLVAMNVAGNLGHLEEVPVML